jgi:TRAP-type transport system periplasmic protein
MSDLERLLGVEVTRREALRLGLLGGTALSAASILAACASSSSGTTSSGGPTVAMKVAHDSPLTHPYQKAMEAFKKEVESKTNGRIAITIYPNAQLGDEATMVNGLKIGAVDGMFTSTSPISTSVKAMDVFNLPFLFKDSQQAAAAANGKLGTVLKPLVDAATAAEVVGWGAGGDRDMWNSKHPIRTVDDVKGLKMRTQSSKVQQDTYGALGALPTVISFSELYTSVQTGVVDGADNGPVDMVALKFYQVTKYLTLTRHFTIVVGFLVSNKFMSKLSAGDQDIVRTAGKNAAAVESQGQNDQSAAAVTELKSQGIQVFELDDPTRQAFIDKVQGVYTKDQDAVGGSSIVQLAKQGAS